ncbi:hypothetical protein EMIT0P260_110129 [Pseudomonas sp. IT-P260]
MSTREREQNIKQACLCGALRECSLNRHFEVVKKYAVWSGGNDGNAVYVVADEYELICPYSSIDSQEFCF